jgi:hypothetical protein
MNTSPSPDVDRVLDRVGRSEFGYRSFPTPVDEAPPISPSMADAAAPDGAPTGLFSLIGAALPAAIKADVAPVAVMAPATPFPPPMQTRVQAQVPPPPPPGPPEARAANPRSTPLADVFRLLLGHAGGAPSWRDARRQEAAFPFRRR